MARHTGASGTGFQATGRNVAAVFSTFNRASRPRGTRNALGLIEGTNEIFFFDTVQLMHDHVIGSKVIVILGHVGSQKTRLAMELGIDHSMSRMSRRDRRKGKRMRLSVEEIRRKGDKGEYDKYAELFFDSVPIRPMESIQRLNFFHKDFGLTAGQHAKTAYDVFKTIEKRSPTAVEAMCISSALEEMLNEMDEFASFETLGSILLELMRSPQLVHDSVNRAFNEPLKQRAAELAESTGDPERDARIAKQIARVTELANDKVILGSTAIAEAARTCIAVFHRLLVADFRGVFGGFESLAADLEQAGVVFDMSRLSEDAMAIVDMFLWELRKQSIADGSYRFVADTQIHDENYRRWNRLEYGESVSDAIKQIRTTRAMMIFITHRLRDYLSVGGSNSRERMLATNFVGEADVFFIGRLDRRDGLDLMDIRSQVTLEDVDRIEKLEPGVFAVIIGRLPVQYVDTRAFTTPDVMEAAESNQANNELYDAAFVEGGGD